MRRNLASSSTGVQRNGNNISIEVALRLLGRDVARKGEKRKRAKGSNKIKRERERGGKREDGDEGKKSKDKFYKNRPGERAPSP